MNLSDGPGRSGRLLLADMRSCRVWVEAKETVPRHAHDFAHCLRCTTVR